jgi:hypothetical protein
MGFVDELRVKHCPKGASASTHGGDHSCTADYGFAPNKEKG